MNQKSGVFCSSLFLVISLIFFMFPQLTMATDRKVVVSPLCVHGDSSRSFLQQGIQSMLVARLSKPGIDVIGAQEGEAVQSQEQATTLGKEAGAEYVLWGSVTSLGGNYSLDIAVLNLMAKPDRVHWISKSIPEAELLAAVDALSEETIAIISAADSVTVPEIQPQATLRPAPALPARTQTSAAEQKKPVRQNESNLFQSVQEAELMAPVGTLPLDIEVQASATGDLNNDGSLELVVLSREKLLVYTRQNDSFVLKDQMTPSFGAGFIKVSMGDINGNGKEEIAVVSFSGMKAVSTVWEWDGRFRKLYEQEGHLRITRSDAEKKSVLLFQESMPAGEFFFAGKIWRMSLSGASGLVKKEPLKLSPDAQFYTIVFLDINSDGQDEILYLGEANTRGRGVLTLADNAGETLWESQDTFGATNNVVELEEDANSTDGYLCINLNAAPVAIDCNGDGRKEVVVATNLAPVDFIARKTVKKSILTVFAVNDMGLTPLRSSRENPYPVMDMHSSEGLLFLSTHSPRLTSWNKASGKVCWFR